MVSWQVRALETFLRFQRLASRGAGELDIARERAETESLAAMFKPVGQVRCEPVRAGDVPAEWIVPAEEVPGRAILYLHGGSFNAGSIQSHRTLAGNLALESRSRALLIDYRLAPEHPFPAGIEDAIQAYEWLLEQGFAPGKLAIAGDSAGGTLALNLLVFVRDQGGSLPVAGVCLSPAPDLSFSGASWAFNAKKDLMLVERKERRAVELYLGTLDPRSPQASPSFADLRGLPPLLLQVGSHELLLSDVEQFAEKARAAGVDVTLEVWPGMQHEWQFAANFLPEGKRAVERIGAYLEAAFERSKV